ncbi:MAG: tetratricopeptide repeat protein [Spirochaetia bacterium]
MSSILYQLRMRRALNAMSTGEHAVARKIWRKLSKHNPDAQGMRHNIALTYIGEERYAEAEPLLLGEIEDFGEYYPRVRALADMYYAWGKGDAAAEWYGKAVEGDDCPNTERKLLKRRSEVASDETRYSKALESVEQVREGNRLLAEDRWEEARACFERAVELDPTNIQAMNNAGSIALNHEGAPETAKAWFEKALKWSELPWLRKNLATAQRALANTGSHK